MYQWDFIFLVFVGRTNYDLPLNIVFLLMTQFCPLSLFLTEFVIFLGGLAGQDF